MSLYRVGSSGNGHEEAPANTVPVEVYLADLKNERDCLISRLRCIDKILIDYGQLREETIARRVR